MENGVQTRENGGAFLSTKRSQRAFSCLMWLGMFIILYIFYRYVNPAIIWDGDDWHTNDYGTPYILFSAPNGTLTNYNVLSNALGSVFGYVAAFIVYPITKDYIISYVVADAVARAGFIALSNYIVWRQLKRFSDDAVLPWLGMGIFFVSAFTFMKTASPSTYLYWTYNRCTVYYYCIPSYLAGAFSVFLICEYIKPGFNKRDNMEKLFYNAALIIALYFLMFSFLPAAVLIAVVAFVICAYDLMTQRDIKGCVKRNWVCVLALALFVAKMWFEYSRTVTSGYIVQKTHISLDQSLRIVLGGFKNMHPLFKLIMWGGVLFAADSMMLAYKREKSIEPLKNWLLLVGALLSAFVIMMVFFVLFGVISSVHVIASNILRNDNLYCMQFMLLLLVAVLWMYIWKEHRNVCVLMPVVVCMMVCVAINPGKPYSDSKYTDTTQNQKYQVMSAVVDAIQEKSEKGEGTLTIHMPAYSHWGSNWISTSMQYHNLIDRYVKLTFVYDANVGEIWFE